MTFSSGRLAILFALTAIVMPVAAQEIPPEAEPPPLKVLTKKERSTLEKEKRVKKRTKLALTLMEDRLLRAEDAKDNGDFKEMFTELGRFHAIIDHTLQFLDRKDSDSRKVLFNFKRLEIGLRRLIPRIELIRREVPLKYQYYVRSLVKNVRKARSRAVEPLFDDTVIEEEKDGRDS